MSDEYTSGTEQWLEADTEATDADPKAAAKVLRGIAQTLSEAPNNRRYDISLTVDERTIDTDTE